MRQNFVVQVCKHIFNMVDVLKPKVVFVLGRPGAGKGTQCANIAKEFGFVHISAGDLLREERSKPGKLGELIDEYFRNGTIVPVEITCKLIETAMQNSGKQKFVIDGFPIDKDNLEGWNKVMAEKVELLFVLFFDCPEDICVQRCLKRGVHGSGRTDDNEESLKKRMQTYLNVSMPIIEHFNKKELVHRINADQEPKEVFGDIKLEG
ncbi:UMP-CMP kinase-like [Homalodisca vitripennis]|uniref:UMP-CMP kinase-like n=1 Tax=Homalodisca vitripennis TaxID=197043 RepID=UPI001EEAA4FB|nr:UMP-CMP kinase-like [Homalodisca vitripennis]